MHYLQLDVSVIQVAESKLIGQLLDPKTAEDYVVSYACNPAPPTLTGPTEDQRHPASLPASWCELAKVCGIEPNSSSERRFLYKSNLHGILCDDMGLGKSLQVLMHT